MSGQIWPDVFFFALHAVSSKAPPAGKEKAPYTLAEKKNSIGGKKTFPFRKKRKEKNLRLAFAT